ncbi:MAG: hypothetical protein KH009_05330 [Clostridiales bacterium]|nr:hypothetical protein [Clostridiales bacterium]
MNETQKEIFQKEYMPYIIRWGKITCWLSIPLIFIPAVALYIFYQAVPSVGGVITGFIALASSMVAWYVVDPITLYPILHIPGMYMTYIAGNSKEIRAPAATAALSSADVEAGTEHGTIISAIAISVSIFISVAVMTLVALAGNFILSLLPAAIISALNYLLPALFGAMCMQRIMMDYKSAFILLPCALVIRYLSTLGLFQVLPFGGGYAPILSCVVLGVLVAKTLHGKAIQKA